MRPIKETFYLKLNIYLLLAIIPLSVLGYYFAVYRESLFFLYEGLLAALIIFSVILAIRNIAAIQSELKWTAISILAFFAQFSVLALFLGPLTHYPMIYLYYTAAVLSFIVFVTAIRKNTAFRLLPVLFIVLTSCFTLYILLLHSLWGNQLN
ncbi:hypothetical protein [Bacillus thermotolerans]|uniref:hypothetical protein n=1 Tax=Bacillus thermotolerans TaxID=1221996 RepID=UPI001E2DADDD|nr:hypothetical protein [Bacillus thermotolerans]